MNLTPLFFLWSHNGWASIFGHKRAAFGGHACDYPWYTRDPDDEKKLFAFSMADKTYNQMLAYSNKLRQEVRVTNGKVTDVPQKGQTYLLPAKPISVKSWNDIAGETDSLLQEALKQYGMKTGRPKRQPELGSGRDS